MSMATTAAVLSSTCGKKTKNNKSQFRYCLNTSTISGQKPGVLKSIDIAAEAGYDGIELWIRDIKTYLKSGRTLTSLKQHIDSHGIQVESAIGFAPWMTGGKPGFDQMKEEMEIMAALGCRRIAAPPAGVPGDPPLDFFMAGEKYAQLLELGRQTGVMPQLEFWGASKAMWHLGQVLMVAAAANDPDVRLLPDVYHLFRGGSDFNGLKMLNGQMIEIFHMNDYPGDIPREKQNDSDRVYPGDGVAPLKEILTSLKNMGEEKVLSLELFNKTYWQQDALTVAKTGLAKMKCAVSLV